MALGIDYIKDGEVLHGENVNGHTDTLNRPIRQMEEVVASLGTDRLFEKIVLPFSSGTVLYKNSSGAWFTNTSMALSDRQADNMIGYTLGVYDAVNKEVVTQGQVKSITVPTNAKLNALETESGLVTSVLTELPHVFGYYDVAGNLIVDPSMRHNTYLLPLYRFEIGDISLKHISDATHYHYSVNNGRAYNVDVKNNEITGVISNILLTPSIYIPSISIDFVIVSPFFNMTGVNELVLPRLPSDISNPRLIGTSSIRDSRIVSNSLLYISECYIINSKIVASELRFNDTVNINFSEIIANTYMEIASGSTTTFTNCSIKSYCTLDVKFNGIVEFINSRFYLTNGLYINNLARLDKSALNIDGLYITSQGSIRAIGFSAIDNTRGTLSDFNSPSTAIFITLRGMSYLATAYLDVSIQQRIDIDATSYRSL